MSKAGLDGRHRNKDGEISGKHGNTLVSTLCVTGLFCVPRPAFSVGDFSQVTFTIRASKDGETIETVRIGPTATVAKARGLFETGWMVHIIDDEGSVYAPLEFDRLLSFDRPKSPKESSRADVLAMLENILADRHGRK